MRLSSEKLKYFAQFFSFKYCIEKELIDYKKIHWCKIHLSY